MEELVKHSVQQLGQLYGKGKSAKAHAGLALNAHPGNDWGPIPVLGYRHVVIRSYWQWQFYWLEPDIEPFKS